MLGAHTHTQQHTPFPAHNDKTSATPYPTNLSQAASWHAEPSDSGFSPHNHSNRPLQEAFDSFAPSPHKARASPCQPPHASYPTTHQAHPLRPVHPSPRCPHRPIVPIVPIVPAQPVVAMVVDPPPLWNLIHPVPGNVPNPIHRVHVFLDHSNLTVARYATPANFATLHAHIEMYGNRVVNYIAGTGVDRVRLPGVPYTVLANVRQGSAEHGIPDIALILRAYDTVELHRRHGVAPGVIVLCTGDGNNENRTDRRGRPLSFPAVARHAITEGWKVVIYARDGTCNSRLKRIVDERPDAAALFLMHQRTGGDILPYIPN